MKISHYILSYLRLDKRIFCHRYDGVYYAYTFGRNDFGKFDHFMFEWLYQHQNIVFPLIGSHDWQFTKVGV